MASKDKYFVYWDSSVFLSWVNEIPSRVDIIRGMWDDITKEKNGIIVTSALSVVEVAKSEKEQNRRRIDPTIEQRLDEMWADPHILIVEAPSYVMRMARKLMRDVVPRGWSLKPYDAVQLATAKFLEANGRLVQEINTYDDWGRYSSILNMTICEPHYTPPPPSVPPPPQPKFVGNLFGDEE